MSIFYCHFCQQQCDADFVGHNLIGDKESCDDCNDAMMQLWKMKIFHTLLTLNKN